MNALFEAIGLKEKKNKNNAANTLIAMGRINQKPAPISIQPKTPEGLPKQWVQTPYTGSQGTEFSPHWSSPVPKLTLPKGGRRKKTARKTRRRSKHRKH